MNRFSVIALRVLLVVLAFGCLFAQLWLVPQLAGDVARSAPELAYLAAPYTVLWILVFVCAQLIVVALWVLLSKVRRGAIFAENAFRWVDVIIIAGATATLLIFGFELHLLGIVDAGGPPLGILLTGIVLAGAAGVLLMIVMRGLLRSATSLQSELDEVV